MPNVEPSTQIPAAEPPLPPAGPSLVSASRHELKPARIARHRWRHEEFRQGSLHALAASKTPSGRNHETGTGSGPSVIAVRAGGSAKGLWGGPGVLQQSMFDLPSLRGSCPLLQHTEACQTAMRDRWIMLRRMSTDLPELRIPAPARMVCPV